jgi:hypothetical protein
VDRHLAHRGCGERSYILSCIFVLCLFIAVAGCLQKQDKTSVPRLDCENICLVVAVCNSGVAIPFLCMSRFRTHGIIGPVAQDMCEVHVTPGVDCHLAHRGSSERRGFCDCSFAFLYHPMSDYMTTGIGGWHRICAIHQCHAWVVIWLIMAALSDSGCTFTLHSGVVQQLFGAVVGHGCKLFA